MQGGRFASVTVSPGRLQHGAGLQWMHFFLAVVEDKPRFYLSCIHLYSAVQPLAVGGTVASPKLSSPPCPAYPALFFPPPPKAYFLCLPFFVLLASTFPRPSYRLASYIGTLFFHGHVGLSNRNFLLCGLPSGRLMLGPVQSALCTNRSAALYDHPRLLPSWPRPVLMKLTFLILSRLQQLFLFFVALTND